MKHLDSTPVNKEDGHNQKIFETEDSQEYGNNLSEKANLDTPAVSAQR
jgi:hypothetical protein